MHAACIIADPVCRVPFIGPPDCVSNFSLNSPVHPECKGRSVTATVFAIPFGSPDLSLDYTLLTGETGEDIGTPILPLSNFIEHPLTLPLLPCRINSATNLNLRGDKGCC